MNKSALALRPVARSRLAPRSGGKRRPAPARRSRSGAATPGSWRRPGRPWRARPWRATRVIDGTGADAVDVGFPDHRHQRLLRRPARLALSRGAPRAAGSCTTYGDTSAPARNGPDPGGQTSGSLPQRAEPGERVGRGRLPDRRAADPGFDRTDLLPAFAGGAGNLAGSPVADGVVDVAPGECAAARCRTGGPAGAGLSRRPGRSGARRRCPRCRSPARGRAPPPARG